MGLLEKVKNFFYDEDYEEDEEKEEIKKTIKPKKEKIKVTELKEEKHQKLDRQDISERQLFQAERTFNFPVDVEDEYYGIKEEKEDKINKVEERVYKREEPEYKSTMYSGIRDYAKTEVKEEPKQEKRFKPTPVISPIYGIMDKNYKKEDIMIDSAKEVTTPKKVDYDSVRKRAYSNVYKEEQQEDNTKGIFYNLDEEENENSTDDDDVKIIYNDVTFDENEEDDENVTIGQKIEEYENKEESDDEQDDISYDEDEYTEDNDEVDDYEEENNDYDENEIDEESQILSETKEQDLFNLIDNMYNSDEEDEEEDDE